MHTCSARIISYYDNYAYLIGYLFVSFCHGEWSISYTWRLSLHRVWKWRTALCFLQVDANAFWSHDWCEGARRHSRPGTCAIVAAPQFRCKHFVPKSNQTQRYANTFQIGKAWKNSTFFSNWWWIYRNLHEFMTSNSPFTSCSGLGTKGQRPIVFLAVWRVWQYVAIPSSPCNLRGVSVGWSSREKEARRNPGNGLLWCSFVQPPCYFFSFRQRQMELVDLGKSRPPAVKVFSWPVDPCCPSGSLNIRMCQLCGVPKAT